MRYRIVSVVYGWKHLKRGFLRSAKKNTKSKIELIEKKEPFGQKKKHEIWAKEAKRGGNVVLIDTDTIILKDLHEVFYEDFDIGITVRNGRSWLNAGVVFVKPTQAAYDILDLWAKEIKSKNQSKYKKETKHAGTAQPVFAWLYKNGKFKGVIKRFPCRKYNCVQPWKDYEKASVIHVKSRLRDSLFSGKGLRGIVKFIKHYYD